MSTLTRYLTRIFIVRLLVVTLAITGFALLFDLLDVGPRVIRRSGGSVGALPAYALLRLPTLLSELVPMIALVAGLLAATDLLRFRELVAMWGSGVSRLGLLARLWPVTLLVVGAKLAIDDWGVPASVPQLRALGVADLKTVGLPTGQAIWLRVGQDVLRLPSEAAVLRRPRDVMILRLDQAGQLVERLEAVEAEPGPEGWLLRGVTRRPAGPGAVERRDELFWPAGVDLDKVALMARLPRELSLRQLVEVIAAGGFGVGGTEGHRTWLQARLAGCLALAALTMLPFALVRSMARVGASLAVFAKGLAIGFLYIIGNGLLLAFGELGLIHPAAAAWTAPLMLAALLLFVAGAVEPRAGRAAPARARA